MKCNSGGIMFMHILNYSIRALTIVLGIVLLTGVLFQGHENKFLTQVMGVVFILWGTYRLIIYRINVKRYKSFENEEEE